MKHHIFEQSEQYPVAILIKGTAFNKGELQRYYVEPLSANRIPIADVIAFTLAYGDKGKVSVKEIKEYLGQLLPVLEELKTKYLYVADSNYFKTLTGVTKAEPHHGYVMPCKIKGYEHMNVVLGINYHQLIYNPDLQDKLTMGIDTLAAHINGTYKTLGSDIIHSAWYPESLDGIAKALNSLHQYPKLAGDIEAFSLRFNEAGIGTVSFAWDQHNGIAFPCDYLPNPSHEKDADGFYGKFVPNPNIRAMLLAFLLAYKGEITWHNAAYDVKVIIFTLWMQHLRDTKGLLAGLHHMYRKGGIQDTKLIIYLATNSTAGNTLGLKPNAHEFAGNWAKDDIKDIRKIPLPELLQYNLVDALSTNYVREKYYPIMVADKQEALYHKLFLPTQKMLTQVELTGMPMSKAKIAQVKAKLEKMRDEYLHTINSNELVVEMNLWVQTREMNKANAKLKTKQHPLEKFADHKFNPNSGPQLQFLLYELMNLPVLDLTDTKQPATGAETLEKLINHVSDPLQKDLINALIGHGQVVKILNTFIPAFEAGIEKADDGIIWLHGWFNLGGTVSGRLSSCVAAWTRIKTQRGLIPITELKIGEYVWTHKRRWQPVQDIILKPVTPMVDVRFCNGYILTCTMDHKLRLPNGMWKTVREIINERIENVDAESCEHILNISSLSKRSTENSGTDCIGIGDDLSQYQPCAGAPPSNSRVSGSQSLTIFSVERRGTQSYEGKNAGTAPQLDWGMLGSQGVFNNPAQRDTSVCAPCGYGTSLGIGDVTGAAGSPSHRRESIEQCAGQLSPGNESRPYDDSLSSSDVSYGKIEAIHYRGDLPVWDITVAEDHSYWAEGCFNHNSDPNLQNIPANSIFGKLIKECFGWLPGWIFAGADFNSLEDYVSALQTKDPNKLKVYIDGFDGHCLRAAFYFEGELLAQGVRIDINDPKSVNSLKKLAPEWRQESKTPTFLLTYGGTYHGLMKSLGWPEEKAKRIEANYHDLYKVSDQYVADRLKQANKDGYVEVAFGLRVRTPLIKQVLWSDKGSVPYEAQGEGRTAGNALGQSYGQLTNRSMVAFMEKVWESPYAEDILPCSLIHDANYLLIRDNPDIVAWANKYLINEMRWQELPEIQHDTVKLGAALDIFWPHWANAITLPNDADPDTIIQLCRDARTAYLEKQKEKQ